MKEYIATLNKLTLAALTGLALAFVWLSVVLSPGFIDLDVLTVNSHFCSKGELSHWFSWSYSWLCGKTFDLSQGIHGIYFLQTWMFGAFAFVFVLIQHPTAQNRWISIVALAWLLFLPSNIALIFSSSRDLFYALTTHAALLTLFLHRPQSAKLSSTRFLWFLVFFLVSLDLKQQSVFFSVFVLAGLVALRPISKRQTLVLITLISVFELGRSSLDNSWMRPKAVYQQVRDFTKLNYLLKNQAEIKDDEYRRLEEYLYIDRVRSTQTPFEHPPISQGLIKNPTPDRIASFNATLRTIDERNSGLVQEFRRKMILKLNGFAVPRYYFVDLTGAKSEKTRRMMEAAKIDTAKFSADRSKVIDIINRLLHDRSELPFLKSVLFSTLIPLTICIFILLRPATSNEVRVIVGIQLFQLPFVWLLAPMPIYRYSLPIIVTSFVAVVICNSTKGKAPKPVGREA